MANLSENLDGDNEFGLFQSDDSDTKKSSDRDLHIGCASDRAMAQKHLVYQKLPQNVNINSVVDEKQQVFEHVPEQEERGSVMERHDVSQRKHNNPNKPKKESRNRRKAQSHISDTKSNHQSKKKRRAETEEKSIMEERDEETESRFGVLGQE